MKWHGLRGWVHSLWIIEANNAHTALCGEWIQLIWIAGSALKTPSKIAMTSQQLSHWLSEDTQESVECEIILILSKIFTLLILSIFLYLIPASGVHWLLSDKLKTEVNWWQNLSEALILSWGLEKLCGILGMEPVMIHQRFFSFKWLIHNPFI